MPDFYNIHPYCALAYFAGVILYSMVFMHPVTVAANVILSFAASISLGGKEILASAKYTIFAGIVIAVVNPLFNPAGSTVLFTYFGRNYTYEALVYGIIMGGIFIISINWFGCMGRVITSDKFMYIFGGRLPTLCLILTMVIGLIPFFQKKLSEISSAGSLLIKGSSKTRQAFRALSVATGYTFEHSVNLSVSMKNRGYGTGKTTRITNYTVKIYDIIFIIITAVLNVTVICLLSGSAVNIEIIPAINIPVLKGTGFTGFTVLLALPCIMYLFKELKWLYLKSKI
ncbi:MAG: hypothetical protein IKJ05_09250 [Oscillospiraceae bacterium]|nr:hypothetical protein [Oscillospiraceae bacterium]